MPTLQVAVGSEMISKVWRQKLLYVFLTKRALGSDPRVPRQANGIAESCCLAAGFLWRGGVVVGFQADL